jgi:hypothetical protein
MATCPTCRTEAHTFSEMAVPMMPDGKTSVPHAAPRMTRKCVNCRQPWPEEPTVSTAPAAPMPAAASLAPAAHAKANGNGVSARHVAESTKRFVEVTDRRHPAPPQHVPAAPDYEAMMFAELDALDEAEQHIASRRAYLHDLLGRLTAAAAAHPAATTN